MRCVASGTSGQREDHVVLRSSLCRRQVKNTTPIGKRKRIDPSGQREVAVHVVHRRQFEIRTVQVDSRTGSTFAIIDERVGCSDGNRRQTRGRYAINNIVVEVPEVFDGRQPSITRSGACRRAGRRARRCARRGLCGCAGRSARRRLGGRAGRCFGRCACACCRCSVETIFVHFSADFPRAAFRFGLKVATLKCTKPIAQYMFSIVSIHEKQQT